MNDETAPPPLRLKPRVRPTEAPAEEIVAEAPAPKLRVKPRMTPDAPVENIAVTTESSAGDPGAVRAGGLESSKFKFRNSAGAPSAETNDSTLGSEIAAEPEPAMDECADTLPPIGEEAPLADVSAIETSTETAAPLPHAEEPATASEDPPVFPVMAPDLPVGTDGSALIGGLPGAKAANRSVSAPPPEQRKSFRYGVVATMVLLALVLLGGTYYILKHFFGAPPPPLSAKIKVVKPTVTAASLAAGAKSVAGATPTAVPNPIGKAKEAIAGRRADEQARVNALANGEEPSPRPTLRSTGTVSASSVGRAAPLESSAPPAEPTMLAPGVSTQMGAEVKATDASPEFRTFVASARISGVFQGNPPRAFINGKLARAGDMVDVGLGVTFDHVDGTKKEVVFKDASGATVARKY